MKSCLFLGYNKNKTSLISFIKSKNWKIKNHNKTINYFQIYKHDLIISFGYKKIIKKELLKKIKKPIINLHISYLPYNRGSHPNFWSHIEETPSGVSIHKITEKLDSGPILFQKKISFNLKDKKQDTFRKTYKILFKEIEKLFKKNFDKIVSGNYKLKNQAYKQSTYHSKSELPEKNFNWNNNILNFKKKYKSYL